MHMPGHKRQLAGAYKYDITEIDGFDNLNDAQGILAEMNADIARHYDSKVSFFTVNGSTCGNLAAISAVADAGDTILVARNCHKSVYNAIYLRKLRAHYIYPTMYNDKIIGAVTLDSVRIAVDKLRDRGVKPGAAVITSPTYEGVVSDIASISKYLHEQGIPLIVDSAHGAHLHFDDTFPRDNIGDIDVCIMSAHKTLPVLNQGAIVHVNSKLTDADDVMRYISMYQTSSPSYVIMESMSRALELIDEKNRWVGYIANLRRFYADVSGLKRLSVEPEAPNRDFGKVIIYTNGYMTGDELSERLREQYSFEMELSCDGYVLGMTSLMDTGEVFEKLAKALMEIDASLDSNDRTDDVRPFPMREHTKVRESYEITGKCACAPIDECIGEVAGETIIAYPPGIPIVVAGEIILGEDVAYIARNIKEKRCYIV